MPERRYRVLSAPLTQHTGRGGMVRREILRRRAYSAHETPPRPPLLQDRKSCVCLWRANAGCSMILLREAVYAAASRLERREHLHCFSAFVVSGHQERASLRWETAAMSKTASRGPVVGIGGLSALAMSCSAIMREFHQHSPAPQASSKGNKMLPEAHSGRPGTRTARMQESDRQGFNAHLPGSMGIPTAMLGQALHVWKIRKGAGR